MVMDFTLPLVSFAFCYWRSVGHILRITIDAIVTPILQSRQNSRKILDLPELTKHFLSSFLCDIDSKSRGGV